MDKYFHPAVYWVCDYLSMLRFKLTHVSKMGPGVHQSTRIFVVRLEYMKAQAVFVLILEYIKAQGSLSYF